MNLLFANPRGFCAGVDRAVKTVEHALEMFDEPVYVRHEIIHNKTVVDDFKRQGVTFIEDIADVPDGAVLIFSAHGVATAVVEEAQARDLEIIDATCPLVTKVHVEARAFHKKGYHILLVGHVGHVEVAGTAGQVPKSAVTLVEGTKAAQTVEVENPDKLAVLTQTTLSVDETKTILDVLKARFPNIVMPKKGDICYATQNRQDAVKALAKEVDVVLVVGSTASSNSNRLRETALEYGAKRAYLIEGPADLTTEMTEGAKHVGLTAGASAPENVVQAVAKALKPDHIRELKVRDEDVVFNLPQKLRVNIQEQKAS